MNNQSKQHPDFSVQWHDSSQDFESRIYIDNPDQNTDALLLEQLREPLILLETTTTCVAVTEMCWNEPTSISLVPDRPAFSMMVSASPLFSVQYGYEEEQDTAAAIGNTLFLVPGRKITGHGSAGSFRSIMVSFDTAYAETLFGTLGELTSDQLTRALCVQNSLITSLLFRLMKEAMHPGTMSDAVVDACGKTMLVECAHWLNSTQPVADVRGKLTPKHLAIIEEYLNSTHGKLPSVADMAKACGFSERHFLKLFREEKKCTVAQYIKAFQVARAKTYLLDTDLPLKEIAFRLGFRSYNSFSSAFRAATGQSPNALRKKP
ncbi:helix-turn-helix domain-containing protein [Ketobacter sp.]|uniref:helix-turn-helix domain-containing protein n=1 Tax=Ketobacter sp. TaxID=2083498 RepID=UPI000F28BAF0|nr:AraC family transcriptional regulator [Ketobacter sp.]RLU01975.1 MAG: AraC family transcriptional regulator [Ketobacter sp.]